MKRLRNIFFFLIILSAGFSQQIDASTKNKTAQWTVMLYAQTDSILNSFVIKNFQSMATIGSNEKLNIIVQWNQPRNPGTWRYKIEKNEMVLVEMKERVDNFTFKDDLIDFAKFTKKNYPAQNYAFILSNHGLGIIDPAWSLLQNFSVNPAALHCDSRLQIEGITRSILFDVQNKQYLTNQDLTGALEQITKNVIGKKFEIIGMDACLMSMLEVHYQIKNFANYSVSSEEVELAYGWNYPAFLHTLATDTTTAPNLAKNIVSTFEDFYKGKTRFYTQSAIDLDGIDYVRQNLDRIISDFELCRKVNPSKIKKIIKDSRKSSFQLSVSCYIDLHSFYSEVLKQISFVENEGKNKNSNLYELSNSEHFKNLKDNLSLGIKLMDNIVIANTCSDYLCRAKGISIYFPKNTIDPSYLKTDFAQQSLWLPFLQNSL